MFLNLTVHCLAIQQAVLLGLDTTNIQVNVNAHISFSVTTPVMQMGIVFVLLTTASVTSARLATVVLAATLFIRTFFTAETSCYGTKHYVAHMEERGRCAVRVKVDCSSPCIPMI